MGKHGTFGWAGGTTGVAEAQAVFGANFILRGLIVFLILLAHFKCFSEGLKFDAFVIEKLLLFFCEGIEADDGLEMRHIFSLHQGFDAQIIGEECGKFSVVEDVSYVLVSQGVVEGDGGQSI